MTSEREKSPIRVSLLGCGTVGGGVLRLLQENKSFLALRAGAEIEVTHVLVKSPNKPRVPECKKEWITTNPDVIFDDPSVDLVVEVMGGEHPASDYIERAIAA